MQITFDTATITKEERAFVLQVLGIAAPAALKAVEPQTPLMPWTGEDLAPAKQVWKWLTPPARALVKLLSTRQEGGGLSGVQIAEALGFAGSAGTAGVMSGVSTQVVKVGKKLPIEADLDEKELAIYYMRPEVAELFRAVIEAEAA